MRHLLTACGIFTLLAALLAACGDDDGGGPGSAGDYITHLLSLVDKRQFGPEWDSLHPAQQALVPREKYIACSTDARLPGVSGTDVLETYSEAVEIPGTTQLVDSTAVTVNIHETQGALKHDAKQTFHAVLLDGSWRWFLPDSAVSAYAAGRCP